MIKLNSLRNSLNIHVSYVLRSSSSSLAKIKILQKRKTPILNCHFSIKKKQSSFTPPSGRDVYLDFYIEAISQEILHAEPKTKLHSTISKSEFASLKGLARDDSIVLKKADKSRTIVIMNKCG